MARQQKLRSWISAIFELSNGKKRPERRVSRRKLHAEWLENRAVLSTAPLADLQGLSLADYLAEEHAMGPAAPLVMAAADVDAVAAANPVLPATPIALLAGAEGEGEDCTDPNDPTTCGGTGDDGTGDDGTGDDGTGGDGTGGGGTGGDGTGGATCTDPNDPTTCDTGGTGTGGETCTDPNDPTTCGETGGGGTGGDGSGGDGSVGDPSVDNATVDTSSGNIVVNGSLTDDGGASNVTMTLDNGSGTIEIGEDGAFIINVTDPGGYTSFTVTLTDADGNTSTYMFSI